MRFELLERAWSLALHDQRLRYRRAILGPLWITVTNGLVFGVIGVVFSQVLNVPVQSFVPYFAAGMVFWNFFALHLAESCSCFISHEAVIRNSPQPHYLFVWRVFLRNMLYLGHSLVSLVLVFLIFPSSIGFDTTNLLYFALGVLLLFVFAFSCGILVALLSTRWRDFIPLIQNALTVGYLATPILWKSTQVSEGYRWILDWNPLATIFDLIRSPLLPHVGVTLQSIYIVAGFVGFTAVLAVFLFRRYRRQIAFWL